MCSHDLPQAFDDKSVASCQQTCCKLISAVHRSRRAEAGAGVLTYFAGAGAGAGAGVFSPPVKL